MASEATIKFMYIKKISVLLFFIAISLSTSANNGYDLWLKYEKFKDIKLISAYQSKLKSVSISGNSATIQKAKEELEKRKEEIEKKKERRERKRKKR